jgi:hypothetical protein
MVSFDELDAIVLEDFSLCRKLEAETSIFSRCFGVIMEKL